MNKEVTRSVSITSNLKTLGSVTFDFKRRKFHTHYTFDGERKSGFGTFAEILEGANAQQKNIIKGMFKKANVIGINNSIALTEPVVIGDITEEME